ncbi:hypothetical protein SAMN05414139_01814 [Burkholderia sp. D7]|nr:hypothetical protein SAMN05414139_01814 [Burkholderia sp. D7]
MFTACSSHSWVPQKHGARQSTGCVKPSFSEHGYPHASPRVIEPAQGTFRAIRGQPPTNYVRTSNHVANPPRNEAVNAREAVLVPWQLVLAREHWWRSVFMSGFARKRGSHIRRSGEHRAFGAPMNRNCTLWTLRVVRLKAFSLLRFFVALDKEMTCRHAQWLTVIKRISDSRRPLTPKAATRH